MLGFQFVAVAARDKGRAQDFADKLDFRKAYSSYDDVAADPDVGRYLNSIENECNPDLFLQDEEE